MKLLAFREVIVSRNFEGAYYVRFRMAGAGPTVDRAAVIAALKLARYEISEAIVREEELELWRRIFDVIHPAEAEVTP